MSVALILCERPNSKIVVSPKITKQRPLGKTALTLLRDEQKLSLSLKIALIVEAPGQYVIEPLM